MFNKKKKKKDLQSLQENTCAEQFSENIKNTYFIENLQTAAFEFNVI